MSKSILVIDTPKVCIDCPCHFAEDTGRVWCGKEKKDLLSDDIETFKPDWCPLVELPQKKELEKERRESITADFYGEDDSCEEAYLEGAATGFNRCIDTILKEVFENPVPYNGDNIDSRD